MSNSRLQILREATPAVLPSMLLCDFGNLEREIRRLEAAGAKALHLDVMDGQFVPNLTYGMPIVAACRQLSELPLDVHLMIRDPGNYAQQFAEAGADLLTFHVEAVEQPAELIEAIKSFGIGAGIALNPATPLGAVENYAGQCDAVLVMSVNAGFGGQAFDPVALEKLRTLRSRHSDLLLEVDGGINTETIGACREAGADLFVVGSGIFRKDDYASALSDLQTAMQRPHST
ncbi:ribulose-phosphate 3-epimerase [Candidatus Laterigemmans baculatus]|uniref:ribulose-phosphate 3-epimerase n=1 Tax=Candidatus Laterigemmans baculatus TaxID=2770505 RepID=UPI0013DB2724|nr:ribulose-phosphate 3-epimerase [Candidatus Laterigemmans baculatus]